MVRLSDQKFGHGLKHNWPLEPDTVYLNHGAYGVPPILVSRATDKWRARAAANPTRFFEQTLIPEIRRNADLLGGFLNAAGNDLVFVDNVTAGINAVLRSLVLMPGDEIVATSHLFQSVRRTLDFVCERAGARLVLADLPFPARSEGEITAAIMGALSPRTRLLLLDHVTANTGIRLPVETLALRAAERGIPVIVDGTHGPGNLPLDLKALGNAGVGWYIGSGHHWLGCSFGCGFLWVHPDRQSLVRPTAISTRFGEGFTEAFDWTSSKDHSPWLTIEDVLQFRAAFGENRIRDYTHSLARQAAELLSTRWNTQLGAPLHMFSAMATVALPVNAPATVQAAKQFKQLLRDEHAIEVTVTPFSGRLWLRLSAFLYNEIRDYERLANAVADNAGGQELAAIV
ncbi:MAG: aminotransferase class V-fold PLP-dependent enzyme [Pseudomonadota bacterium]